MMEAEPKTTERPLFYEDLIRSYVKAPLFIKRPWLERLILSALEKPDCRFVLLTAEPGAGKSTFAAQLASTYTKWPRYFIRRDQRQPLANAGARSFLMRVGFQLAETYPDLFKRDDIVLDVEQEIGVIDGASDVLGVSVKKLVASPFYRRVMVKVKQNVEKTSGSLKGIQIDTIIADARLLSLNDLQEIALFDPARRLQAHSPKQKVVILVDALDELRYHDTKDNILQWLTGCPIGDLPENVRFILTSRPPDRALTLFCDTQKRNVETLVLELDEEEKASGEIHARLQADARTYADKLVSLASLEPYWARASKTPTAFAADAVAGAEGNLGYLDAIARALLLAVEQRDETTIRALLDLKELPEGLEDLYAFFLGKVQERVQKLNVKVRDPATGEAKYVGVWEEVYLPILGALSVALAPLTAQQIHALGRVNVSLSITSGHLDRLKNFLDQVGDGYRLYHSSFAEFLADPRTAETAPGLYCDPTEWHGYIADHYWRTFHTQPQTCDQYGWYHLPAHLTYAGQVEKLRQLLLDFDWLQAKLDATSITALITDYDLLMRDPHVRQVYGVLRLSAHVLVRDKTQLAGQLLGRLLRDETPETQALVTQAGQWRGASWLRPLTPSLTPPGGPLLWTLGGHTDAIWAVAVSADGRRAVSGSLDKTLKVWDLESGAEEWTLRGHTDWIRAVAVSADGRRAVSASRDNTLKVWNLESGAEERTLRGHTADVWTVMMSPDGRRAVSASDDNTLKVWDLESGAEKLTLRGHTALEMSPDGRRLILASDDNTLKVWNLESGAEERALCGRISGIRLVAASADGRHVILASDDNTLKAWDLENGEELRTLEGHTDEVKAAAVSADGRRAVSVSWDNTLKVWDLESGVEERTLRGHTRGVETVVVSPDGRRAISASQDWTLKVWDLKSGVEERTLSGHTGEVWAVAVSADGRRAVSASSDKTLKVWDLESGTEEWTLHSHTDLVNAVAVSVDGRRAVSASSDKTLKVWDLESGVEERTLSGHTAAVQAVVVSTDGRRAISGSEDGTLKVWDLESGAEEWMLRGHMGGVWTVAVCADGRRAISGSWDTTLKVWDLESGMEEWVLRGHTGEISGVAVSAGGRLAVSGSLDKTLKVWDLESGVEKWTLRGHMDWIRAVAVSPDGRRAVSGSEDGTLKVWDMESGEVVAGFSSDGGLYAGALAPDDSRSGNGFTIVAGEVSGRVHFLRLEGVT